VVHCLCDRGFTSFRGYSYRSFGVSNVVIHESSELAIRGTYDPDFLAVHEDGWKRGKRRNALTTSVNLIVVNDHGSSDRISSVDLLLIPTLLPRNLKRVIPPRTGLLRLARSSPFSGFLVNLSKEGNLCARDLFRGIPGNRVRETTSRGWAGI
jgi:hypothetical protein